MIGLLLAVLVGFTVGQALVLVWDGTRGCRDRLGYRRSARRSYRGYWRWRSR